MLNVYLDNQQSALKYLKNTKVTLQNVLIMTGDFNIRDNIWDSLYFFHLVHSNSLIDIVDLFNLFLSHSIQQIPI